MVLAFLKRGALWIIGSDRIVTPAGHDIYWRLTDYMNLDAWGWSLVTMALIHFAAIWVDGRLSVSPLVRAVALVPALFVTLLLALAFLEIGTPAMLQAAGWELIGFALASYAAFRLWLQIAHRWFDE